MHVSEIKGPRERAGSSHKIQKATLSYIKRLHLSTTPSNMSLVNFVPFILDDYKSYRPIGSFNRGLVNELTALSSDWEEDDKELRFSVDVPGVKAADLNVTFKDGQLQISGSRRSKSEDGKTVKRARFSKSFSLNEDEVDVSKMKANLEDGVLLITVPKKPEREPLKITVTTEPSKKAIEVGDDGKKKDVDKEN